MDQHPTARTQGWSALGVRLFLNPRLSTALNFTLER